MTELNVLRLLFCCFCGVCVGSGLAELVRHSPASAAVMAFGWFGYLLMDFFVAFIEGMRRGEQ